LPIAATLGDGEIDLDGGTGSDSVPHSIRQSSIGHSPSPQHTTTSGIGDAGGTSRTITARTSRSLFTAVSRPRTLYRQGSSRFLMHLRD
jgi:hypothetical protein